MIKKVSILAPDLSGGGGTRVYLLAQVLQKLNYEVKVFGFLFGQELYPLPPQGLSVEWVRGGRFPEILTSGARLLRKIDGDILYAVKPRPTSFGVALLKRSMSQTPVILDMDDWELSWFGGDKWNYHPTPRQLARDILKKNGALRDIQHPFYLKWMEKRISQADRITVDTKFLQARFGGTYLPNGKDTDLFNPQKFDPQACRVKYGLSQYRVLMFPGTARPHKGLEDVLTALEQLNQPDFRLVLVGGRDIGDGYVEGLMKRWPQWLIKLPSTPIDQMAEVVAAAHLVVVPQRDNPTATAQFPIKLTDGMAMAKPVLATCVGDIPEILGNTGFLVEPNSPEQIAEAIQNVFGNFEAAEDKGKQARQRCIKFYSINTMATTLTEVLNSVI